MKGTELVGYMPPAQGPFSCDNCKYFTNESLCVNEEVAKDKDMEHPEKGKTKVEPKGCCNAYEKAEFKKSDSLSAWSSFG